MKLRVGLYELLAHKGRHVLHKHVLYALRDAPAAECPKLLHSVAHLVRYAFHVRVNFVLEVTDVPVYALYAVS